MKLIGSINLLTYLQYKSPSVHTTHVHEPRGWVVDMVCVRGCQKHHPRSQHIGQSIFMGGVH